MPEDVTKAIKVYREQRIKLRQIKKEMKATKASREYWHIAGQKKLRDAKIVQLKQKKSKLEARINEMQPSGWQEFLQVPYFIIIVSAVFHALAQISLLTPKAPL